MTVVVLERVAIASVLCAVVVTTVTGCAIPEEPAPSNTPVPTVEPTVEPSPTPTPLAFVPPADCTEILPAAVMKQLAKDGIIILAGPGGKYGDELITEPTPEMIAGGISCYFGIDNEDLSLLEVRELISAVPVTPKSRKSIEADLDAQGLNQDVDDAGNTTFGILGTSNGQTTATYNVITDDSWVSVISAEGGEEAFAEAIDLANAVRDATYR